MLDRRVMSQCGQGQSGGAAAEVPDSRRRAGISGGRVQSAVVERTAALEADGSRSKANRRVSSNFVLNYSGIYYGLMDL